MVQVMDQSVMSEIEANRAAVQELCRRFDVDRLELFGSAVSGEFDHGRSDLDFVVSFSPSSSERAFDNFFGLKDGLSGLFGRPIDLVTTSSLRNPFLRDAVAEGRFVIYAQ